MVDVNKNTNTIRVDVSTAGQKGTVNSQNNAAQYWSQVSKDWAVKMDGMISNEDYSSKYYANQSNMSAVEAEEIKNGILNDPAFVAVANDLTGDGNIATVANNLDDITTVIENLENINITAENIDDIKEKANKDLDNLTTIGENRLEAQKAYLTGNILTDSKGYNELKTLYDGAKFNRDLFVVEGDPTISDAGIATFPINTWKAGNNYIATSAAFGGNPSVYTIEIKNFKLVDSYNQSTNPNAILPVCSVLDLTIQFNNVNTNYAYLGCYFRDENSKYDQYYDANYSVNDVVDLKITLDKPNKRLELSTKRSDETVYKVSKYSLSHITDLDSPIDEQPLYFNKYIWRTAIANNPSEYSINLNDVSLVIDGTEQFISKPDITEIVKVSNNLVELPYKQAKTGSKIVSAEYRDVIQQLYNETGKALYYTIDTVNQNYTIPMGETYGIITQLETSKISNSYLTNCITEVPQEINITLSSGNAILQKGSRVIYPAGVGVAELEIGAVHPSGGTIVDIEYSDDKIFYIIEMPETQGTTTGNTFIHWLSLNEVGLFLQPLALASGESYPTTLTELGRNYTLFWNTTENKVRYYSSDVNTYIDNCSLPLVRVQRTTGEGFTHIFEIFNGCGYCGKHIWVRKGLKCLTPRGTNPDGTYKNLEYTVENMLIHSGLGLSDTATYVSFIAKPGNHGLTSLNRCRVYFEQDTTPIPMSTTAIQIWRNPAKNINYIYWANGNITEWTPIDICVNVNKVSGSDTENVFKNISSIKPFQIANAKDIDGTWVVKTLTLADSLTLAGSATTTFDISEYLPNDGEIYEVAARCYSQVNSTSTTAQNNLYLTGGMFSAFFGKAQGASVFQDGTVRVLVSGQRQLTLAQSNNYDVKSIHLYLQAYRKVR